MHFLQQLQAWVDRAAELEIWTYDRLIVRYDRIIFYHSTDRREKGATYWYPIGSDTTILHDPRVNEELDQHFLRKHFERGNLEKRANLVSIPTTDPETNTCRYLGFDIDQHDGDDAEKAAANWATTQEIVRRLSERRLTCLIEDSNGAGGYHVWVVFSDRVNNRDVYTFAQNIVEGLGPVETFPKSAAVRKGGDGNGLRLFGVHHTKNHVSLFWDGSEWLEGADAVRYVLESPTNDPQLIPQAPTPEERKRIHRERPADLRQLDDALTALDASYADDYDKWVRVMLALAREANQHPQLADDLKDLAVKFSSEWWGFDEEKFDVEWDQFLNSTGSDQDGQDVLTVASIYKWARECGWSAVPPLVRKRSSIAARTKHDELNEQINLTKIVGETTESETIVEESEEIVLPTDRPLHTFENDEVGNSERFAYLFAGHLVYVTEWSAWLIYDGTRWKRDNAFNRVGYAEHMIKLMRAETDLIQGKDDEDTSKRKKAWLAHVRESSKRAAITNLIELARWKMAVSSSQFDQTDPNLLNCLNGVVDLRTGNLLPHRSDYWYTTISPIRYNPKARSERFQTFLSAVFEKHADLIPFLQRLAGYWSTGLTTEQFAMILYGDGANGKSKLVELLQKVLGSDLVGKVSMDLFVKSDKFNQSKLLEIAALHGKRFVYTEESEAGDILHESVVKSVTGSAQLVGRKMYKDAFTFESTAKVAIVTNHLPRIQHGGHGVWRRLVVIPFDTLFWDPQNDEDGPEHLKQNPHIVNYIFEEAEGVLNWIIQGAVEYYKSGLQIPESARLATQNYRSDQSILERFVDESCELTRLSVKEAVDSKQYEVVEEVYQAYLAWAEREGYRQPVSKPTFKSHVEKSYKQIQNHRPRVDGERLRVWLNIKLRTDRGDAILHSVESMRHRDWRIAGDAVPHRMDHTRSGPDQRVFENGGPKKSIQHKDLYHLDHVDHEVLKVSTDRKKETVSDRDTTTAIENSNSKILSENRGPRGPLDVTLTAACDILDHGFVKVDHVDHVKMRTVIKRPKSIKLVPTPDFFKGRIEKRIKTVLDAEVKVEGIVPFLSADDPEAYVSDGADVGRRVVWLFNLIVDGFNTYLKTRTLPDLSVSDARRVRWTVGMIAKVRSLVFWKSIEEGLGTHGMVDYASAIMCHCEEQTRPVAIARIVNNTLKTHFEDDTLLDRLNYLSSMVRQIYPEGFELLAPDAARGIEAARKLALEQLESVGVD